MSDEVGVPPIENYRKLQQRLAQELAGQTKESVLREQGGMDLDDLPKQDHSWVRRGIKMSCEGAMHPHHSHFLVRR